MSVVVGFGPQRRGRGAVELGLLLARSLDLPLVVCCAVPNRWEPPSPARVDADYDRALRSLASTALDEARSVVDGQQSPSQPVEYVVRTGRSVPATLVEVATQREASFLVLGSSSHGSWGHVALGSVTDRLLHSSPLPLALAPRGYRAGGARVVTRVTVALSGLPTDVDLLTRVGRSVHGSGAELRVATFAVRGRTVFPPEVGLHAEDAVLAQWREQAATVQARTAAAVAGLPDVASPADCRVVDGRDWGEAMSSLTWDDGDLLAVGSSLEGPLARVFLGSTATRIVRHAPVPVVIVPR